jgi:hypothetical protein
MEIGGIAKNLSRRPEEIAAIAPRQAASPVRGERNGASGLLPCAQ